MHKSQCQMDTDSEITHKCFKLTYTKWNFSSSIPTSKWSRLILLYFITQWAIGSSPHLPSKVPGNHPQFFLPSSSSYLITHHSFLFQLHYYFWNSFIFPHSFVLTLFPWSSKKFQNWLPCFQFKSIYNFHILPSHLWKIETGSCHSLA